MHTTLNFQFWIGILILLLTPLWALEGTNTPRPMTYDPATPPHYGYMEYLPPGYSTGSGTYPLVVFLHGIGERGNGTSDLWRVEVNGVPTLIRDGRDFPAIVISPQAPPGGVGWFWHKYIVDLISYCKQHYRIDANRVYVTGISAGGGTTWSVAEAWPGVAAAFAPICGAAEPDPIVKAATLRRLPVWAFHNNDDTTVYPSKTKRWMNAIVKAATGLDTDVMANFPGFLADATTLSAFTAAYSTSGGWNWSAGVSDRSSVSPSMFTLYAKGGHDSWTKTYDNDQFWDWLFRQHNTAPTISDVTDQSVNPGGTTGDLPFTVDDAQLHPDYLKVTATSSNAAVVPPGNIVLSGSGSARTVRATSSGIVGSTTITLTVSDSLLTASDSFSLSNGVAPLVDVIVDNRDAARTTTAGPWWLTAATPGFYATDYLVAVPGSDCTATFRPNLPNAGTYEVSMQYPANSSRGISPVTINYGDGTAVLSTAVDQRVNGGTWFQLGTFPFSAGPAAAVTIRSLGAGGYVSADAVRFKQVPTQPSIDLIVDNNDATRVTRYGTWTETTFAPGYYGPDYVSTAPDAANQVIYRPNLAHDGLYKISMWYPATPARGTSPVTIRSEDGSVVQVTNVDQRFNGGQWNLLGTFPLDAGGGPSVTIGSFSSGGWIGADAIRFQETTATD